MALSEVDAESNDEEIGIGIVTESAPVWGPKPSNLPFSLFS